MKLLDERLERQLEILNQQGIGKAPERVIENYIPPKGEDGPRYKLRNHDRLFIRMNSNNYLSLSNHPLIIKKAEEAAQKYGVGPGAARFIDGTFAPHVELETQIANFLYKPAAKIFNSAYTANCAFVFALNGIKTYFVGDELNHNSIIRAMRIAGVKKDYKGIYSHNNMKSLDTCLSQAPKDAELAVVIFDGVFSMRGDFAPIDKISKVCDLYMNKFPLGIITVMDDSHGIGAYGKTGRGTAEHTNTWPDVITGTFGKAFGINGGFVCATKSIIETIRQKSDTYIYTNPLGPPDCVAAITSLDVFQSDEGKNTLKKLNQRTNLFRERLKCQKWETIEGPHPLIPLLVKNTPKTKKMVQELFKSGILAVGLTFPVVPKGSETIRFQINAAHTQKDIEYVLRVLERLKKHLF